MSDINPHSNQPIRDVSQLVEQGLAQSFQRTDQLFAYLFPLQWGMAALIAAWNDIPQHSLWAWLVGAVLTVTPVFLIWRYPGQAKTRFVIAICQALICGLVMTLTGGRTEIYLLIFGSLVALASYRDTSVLLAASWIIAAFFAVFGDWQPFILLIGELMFLLALLRISSGLLQDHKRFKQILGATFEGISIHQDGRVVAVNPQMALMFGYEMAEMIGQPLSIFSDPDQYAIVQDCIRRRSDGPYRVRARRKDGTQFDVEIQAREFEYRNRSARITAIRDLTHQRQYEQDLEEARRQAEADNFFSESIANLAPNNIFIFDLRSMTNSYSNQGATSYLGYSSDEVKKMGKQFLPAIVHPDDLDFLYTHLDEFKTRRDDEIIEYIQRVRHASGEWRWVVVREKIFRRDSDGTPIEIIGIAQDITDLKRTEEELRQAHDSLERKVSERTHELALLADAMRTSRQQLQDILDHAPAIFVVKDLEGRYEMVNRQWETVFGVSRYAILGKLDEEFFPPEAAKVYVANDQQVIETGAIVRVEEVALLEDGPRTYLSLKFPLRDSDGRVRGLCGIATDITEAKQAQQERAELLIREKGALESARLKSQFLAHMSHEIRTPINGVIGMAELLSGTQLQEDQSAYVASIQHSAQHLMALVSDILDFSKIEAGKLELELVSCDVLELLCDIKQTFRFIAQSKNLKFEVSSAPNVPDSVVTDPTRVRQVLTNLIGNALKFTATGQIFVRIFYDDQGDRPHLRFEVEDTGIGIPEASRHRLFQAFSQGDNSTSRRFGGTGLGLVISEELVRLMGGQMGFTSEVNKGSLFWFIVPVRVSTLQQGIAHDRAVEWTLKPGLRVLVAEDNQINQVVAVKTLERYGCQVDVAQNGKDVLSALEKQVYDLVLMDCHMPEMDGYEATRSIRTRSDYSHIPIIAMTANAMAGDRDLCLSVGMNDYISKPIESENLIRVMARVLDQSTRS